MVLQSIQLPPKLQRPAGVSHCDEVMPAGQSFILWAVVTAPLASETSHTDVQGCHAKVRSHVSGPGVCMIAALGDPAAQEL